MIKAFFLSVLLVLGVSVAGHAADIEAGRERAKACNTCHGSDGMAVMPLVPHLAGQNALYMAHQLRAYRDGKRQHEVMSVVVKDLSDNDIDNLAAFYESLPHGGAQ